MVGLRSVLVFLSALLLNGSLQAAVVCGSFGCTRVTPLRTLAQRTFAPTYNSTTYSVAGCNQTTAATYSYQQPVFASYKTYETRRYVRQGLFGRYRTVSRAVPVVRTVQTNMVQPVTTYSEPVTVRTRKELSETAQGNDGQISVRCSCPKCGYEFQCGYELISRKLMPVDRHSYTIVSRSLREIHLSHEPRNSLPSQKVILAAK